MELSPLKRLPLYKISLLHLLQCRCDVSIKYESSSDDSSSPMPFKKRLESCTTKMCMMGRGEMAVHACQ